MEKYRMPDGSYTKSAIKMSKAWKAVYQPLCDKFGMKIIAYNPYLLFSYNNRHVEMPVELGIQIRDAIQ